MNKDSRGWYTLTRKNVVHFNPQDDTSVCSTDMGVSFFLVFITGVSVFSGQPLPGNSSHVIFSGPRCRIDPEKQLKCEDLRNDPFGISKRHRMCYRSPQWKCNLCLQIAPGSLSLKNPTAPNEAPPSRTPFSLFLVLTKSLRAMEHQQVHLHRCLKFFQIPSAFRPLR